MRGYIEEVSADGAVSERNKSAAEYLPYLVCACSRPKWLVSSNPPYQVDKQKEISIEDPVAEIRTPMT